jgi:hypothetical protein
MSSPKNTRKTSSGSGRSTSLAERPRARALDFTADALVLFLDDGRSLSVPLAWLPRLEHASESQRRAYELLDGGEEVRWEEIDEDLSVPGLMGLPD